MIPKQSNLGKKLEEVSQEWMKVVFKIKTLPKFSRIHTRTASQISKILLLLTQHKINTKVNL